MIGYGRMGLQMIRLFKNCCPHGVVAAHLTLPKDFIYFSANRQVNRAHMTFVAFDLEESETSDQDNLVAIFNAIKEKSTLTFAVANWPRSFPHAAKNHFFINRIEPLTDTVIITQRERILSATGQSQRFQSSKARSMVITIQSITSKMIHAGLVCLDFEDYVKLFKNGDCALATTGIGVGKNRCTDAVDSAFYHINGVKRNDPTIHCRAMYANIHSSEDITI